MDVSATTDTVPMRIKSCLLLLAYSPALLYSTVAVGGRVVELTFTFPTSLGEAYFDSTSLTYCGELVYSVHAALSFL